MVGICLTGIFLVLNLIWYFPAEAGTAGSDKLIQLCNEKICFEFDETDYTLLNVHDYSDSTVFNLEPSPLWRINLINTYAESLTVEEFLPVLSTECQGEKSYFIENDRDDGLFILHLVWDMVPCLHNGSVEVTVSIAAPDTSRNPPVGLSPNSPGSSFDDLISSTRWDMTVTDYNDSLSVFSYDFPLLLIPSFSGHPEHGKLAIPHMSGSLIPNPVKYASVKITYDRDVDNLGKEAAGKTPGMWGMQFSALFERFPDGVQRGLFFAANDTTAWYKRFGYTGFRFLPKGEGSGPGLGSADSEIPFMEYLVRHYPLNNLTPGGFEGKISSHPYSVFIRPFAGDWYTAAQIYRHWALKQPWAAKGPLIQREDFDRTIKDYASVMDINLFDYGSAEELNMALRKYKEYLGGDVRLLCRLVHWYTDWPTDPVPLEGVKDFVQNVQDSLEYRIFPYVHSRGWERRQPDDDELTRENCMATNANGYPFYDYRYRFFIMDPACEPWRNKVVDWAGYAQNELGVQGIYLDNFQGFQACCEQDEYHNHSPGSGNFWLDGFKEMVSRIRTNGKESDSCFSIVQEGKMENLIPLIDANIILYFEDEEFEEFYSDKGIPIPLFAAVYHDYLISAGSTRVPWIQYSRQRYQFPFTNAFSFVNGTKLTLQEDHFLLRKDPDEMPDDPEVLDKDYWKLLGKYSYITSDYLTFGKYMRPPEVKCPEVLVEFFRTWRLGSEQAPLTGEKQSNSTDNLYDGLYILPQRAVQAGAFLAPDSTLGIFLTNFTSETVVCTLIVDFEDYGLTEPSYSLDKIFIHHPNFRFYKSINGPEYEMELLFPPRTVHAFRVREHRSGEILEGLVE